MHGMFGRFQRGKAFRINLLLHSLQYHNGIIDNNPDRKNQCKKGEHVDGKSEETECRQRSDK